MNLMYVLVGICIAILVIGVKYIFYKRKKNNIENTEMEDKNNNMVLKKEQESFFPAIEIIENNNIAPSEKNLIKNELVRNTLAQIDNVVPRVAVMSKDTKNVAEIAKNGKVLFSASISDANKMLSAGGNKVYGTQVSEMKNVLSGRKRNLFTGQTKFTKETELTESLRKQQITNVGMNAAAMVVGQYYMSEINNKLASMKENIDSISDFQKSEYKSRIVSIISKIDEITKNQIDILSNDESRKNSYYDIKNIESDCTKLLGQANDRISESIKDNNLNIKQYFDKVKVIEEWYKWQQILQELLFRIGDLRFTLANGTEKSCLSHAQFNNYVEITNRVNEKLRIWHNNYINSFGVEIDKHRKKGNLFKVREKTIGLIKEEWNYDKVDELIVEQIASQIEPKCYNKIIKDKKDETILIQKYKGEYYNVPSEQIV